MIQDSLSKQLPHILLYPLKSYSLFVIVIFSILLRFLFISVSPFTISVIIIFISWFFKYAYAVLDSTIQGYDTPPQMDAEVWMFTNQRPLKQLIYLAFITTISYYLLSINSFIAIVFFILGTFFLAASAAIIATENSLFMAMNPMKLVLFVKYIGYHYIIVSALFYLPLLTIYLMLTMGFISSLFFMLLTTYLLIMGFHVLGVVVYQRREIFGFTASVSPEREEEKKLEKQGKQVESVLDEVYLLSNADRPKRALTILFGRLQEFNDDVVLHEHLFERFILWQKKAVALEHAKHYIFLLMQQKQSDKALKVYRTCVDIDSAFRIEQPHFLLPLAKLAYDEHRYEFVLQLIENFETVYPQHRDRIEILFMRAKTFTELGQYNEASVIIKQLLEHQEHFLYKDIREFAVFLMKLKK